MGLTLTQTRGLQGCGKSTWAIEEQRANPTLVLISRDDLRRALHNGRWSKQNELSIVAMENAVIADALSRGRSVIVHDTGFGAENELRLRTLAHAHSAQFIVKDFTHVPLDVCIARDLTRLHSVGEKVIRETYARYLAPAPAPRPATIPGLPRAFMVDVDGTIALCGDRGVYEHEKCLDDVPNEPVCELVQDLIRGGDVPVYCSGREERYRALTVEWITRHIGAFPNHLFMRSDDDKRNDAIVKTELYRAYVEGKWNIRFVLDDRTRVVDAWRLLGLPTFQVAPGNF